MDIDVIKEKFGNGEEYSLHLTKVGEDLFSGVIEYNHSTGIDEINYNLNARDFGWLLQNIEMLIGLYSTFSLYEEPITINQIQFEINDNGVWNAFSHAKY